MREKGNNQKNLMIDCFPLILQKKLSDILLAERMGMGEMSEALSKGLTLTSTKEKHSKNPKEEEEAKSLLPRGSITIFVRLNILFLLL